MEKVFLRVYDREIESMIEGGRLDEAVAHCQHILKSFPMHLETYRLLGKTFLEARRYADAADIFGRVLMAVPDDFVSHVGMSIIRDDEGRLDDAIWHMERAFEVQPSNSAIQGELRRLFGRRDGVEPAKIRLSRDALANMYSQGELFNQAIAEIRSVLADDQNRPDLQVMLARAYYRSGQKVEAAEIAASLLKKYPYCMDALRVLVDVLPGTARADNAPVYRNRLQMLDPYSSYAMDSVFASEQVADSAVTLERLDFQHGGVPATSQPDWASSLGIKLNTENKAEPVPEWMQLTKGGEEPIAVPPASQAPEPASAKDANASAIPEWMRSAGWQDSTGKSEQAPAKPDEELPQEPIAKAEIPEWLMSMAPAEGINEADTEPEEPAESLPVNESGIPEWLKPMGNENNTGQSTPEPQQPARTEIGSGSDIPDFLKQFSSTGADTEAPLESQAVQESQPGTGESAWDWDEQMNLNNSAGDERAESQKAEPQKNDEIQPADEDNIPDWLKGIAPAGAVAAAAFNPPEAAGLPPASLENEPGILNPDELDETVMGLHTDAKPPVESPTAEEDEIPDWLKSIAPTEPSGEARTEPQDLGDTQPSMKAVTPDWPSSMTSADALDEEKKEPEPSIEPQPESMESSLPDWLSSLAPDESTGEAHAEPGLPVESQPESTQNDVPDWLSPSIHAESTGESAEPGLPLEPQPESMESAVPDWLSSLSSGDAKDEEKKEPQLPEAPQPESMQSAVPDWFSSQAPAELPAEEIKEPATPAESQPANSESGLPDWLASLGETEAPAGENLIPESSAEPQPGSMESATPDWLSSFSPPESSTEENVEAQPPVEPLAENEDNVPDWLKSIRQKQDETGQPAEPEPLSDQETPAGFEALPPAVAASVSAAATEAATHEVPAAEPAVEPPAAPAPIQGAEAFPDFLTGMGARAAAAAAAASEVANQGITSQQPVPQPPAPPQPEIQEPARPPASPSGNADEAFHPSGEVKPLNIEDDAMAWLESLAAKQGAKPEELLTNPQDRTEEMPDWLRHPDEPAAEQPVAPAPETPRNLPETLPLEPLGRYAAQADTTFIPPSTDAVHGWGEEPPAEEKTETAEAAVPAPVPPVPSDEDTLAWLEDLSGSEEPKVEESPTGTNAAQEQAMDWDQLEPLAPPEVPAPEEIVPPMPEAVTDEADITITSWLNKKDVEEALGKNSTEPSTDLPPAAPAEELPDWLKDLEKPAAAVEPAKPDDDLPEWLRHPIPLEGAGAGPEPATSAWVDENTPADEQAAPTAPEEWVPAEEKPETFPEPLPYLESPQAVEPPSISVPFPASEIVPAPEPMPQAEPSSYPSRPSTIPPTLKQTGMLSLVPAQDKDAELLSNAQNVLDQNSLNESMKLYSKLIRKGRLLDEVIHDLREAIYRYPVDVIIWQTLGDAYMRANRLQDALDAYTKAEELLR